jgi:TetR/AcrR family tetracycline transcriptional repressor
MDQDILRKDIKLDRVSPGRGRRRLADGPALDQARIIETLLNIARSEGLAALNMRRVGSELGVSSRLLYHYVRDKEEMIELLTDAITARSMPDLSHPDWEVRLRNVAAAARNAYTDFPGVPAMILSRSISRVSQPHAAAVREGVLQALRDAGLSKDNVEISYIQFSVILLGSLVMRENVSRAAATDAAEAFDIDAATVERSVDLGLDLLLFGIRRLVP